jgi:DNA-binding NarL/FixJ family response regulator
MPTIVLIGRDEPLLRMMRWILLEEQLDVAACRDAREAIERAGMVRPDVIIFDGESNAEKRRGAELLHALLPSARIVSVHQHAPGAAEPHIRADGHLHKPFHADDLIAAVNDLLAGRAVS